MQIMSVKKNHIARSNEGTGVFLFFFFFRNFGRDISCDINLSLTDVLCRNIYIVRMLRMKYNYLLSFDICLIFYIENGISKIAGNSRYINFYLIRRERNKRAGGKNALRFRNICSENAYGNGNPNIYPKTLLHLLRFFEEKSMTHMFTSPTLNVLKLNVTYRTLWNMYSTSCLLLRFFLFFFLFQIFRWYISYYNKRDIPSVINDIATRNILSYIISYLAIERINPFNGKQYFCYFKYCEILKMLQGVFLAKKNLLKF